MPILEAGRRASGVGRMANPQRVRGTMGTAHSPLDPAALRGRGDGPHSQEMFEARKAPDR